MSDTDRIREICDDWEQYNDIFRDDLGERRNMQRTLFVELKIELDKLERLLRSARNPRPGHHRDSGHRRHGEFP